MSLVRRQGQTERVYEVELCELDPQRFVVNFRLNRQLPFESSTSV
ncbi:MAG: hypothetical protein ACREIV_03450 [Planctomycetaceae bacterium]